MRHSFVFLIFFFSLIVIYKLLNEYLNNWKFALLGVCFLVMSPRIFGHAFFNSRDIPFMCFYLFSTYSLLKFHKAPSIKNSLFHSLICAILIDIRILGIVIPFVTFLVFTYLFIIKKERKYVNNFIIYIATLIFLTILFWPTLWENPILNFHDAFKRMSKFPFNGELLFMGDVIKAKNIPFYYIPLWIAITTPVLYIILFVLGFFKIAQNILLKIRIKKDDISEIIFILTFSLPLLAIIF